MVSQTLPAFGYEEECAHERPVGVNAVQAVCCSQTDHKTEPPSPVCCGVENPQSGSEMDAFATLRLVRV